MDGSFPDLIKTITLSITQMLVMVHYTTPFEVYRNYETVFTEQQCSTNDKQ